LFETRASAVDLEWLYTQTKGARRAKKTHLRVVADEVLEQFKAIENTALELFETKQTVKDPLSLPPSPSQCESYGGCPYRDKCNLSPSDHLASLGARDFNLMEMQKEFTMSESGTVTAGTSSLLANLKAKKAAAQGAPSPVAVFADPAPEPPLGINPPEQALPAPERAKRGPGRPRKNPVEAVPEAPAEPRPMEQLPLPFEGIDYDKLAHAIVEGIIAHMIRCAK
jgi:hypothetical protein